MKIPTRYTFLLLFGFSFKYTFFLVVSSLVIAGIASRFSLCFCHWLIVRFSFFLFFFFLFFIPFFFYCRLMLLVFCCWYFISIELMLFRLHYAAFWSSRIACLTFIVFNDFSFSFVLIARCSLSGREKRTAERESERNIVSFAYKVLRKMKKKWKKVK